MLCAASLIAQEKTYIGARACSVCHPAQFRGQSGSGHARTLHRTAQHPLAAFFTPAEPLERPPGFHFSFLRDGENFRVRADDGHYVTELPLEWAFGAGRHAVTFVSRVSNEYYLEHAFSYYADTRSLDITPRHEALPARTLHQAMGQPLRIQAAAGSVTQCFECHSTGPVSVTPTHELQPSEPGVWCEVCHGPGSAHAEAVRKGRAGAARLIRKPSTLSARELSRFCGRCHRSPTGAVDWDSPWNVRHQPPYLEQSRCFRQSQGKLSCLTCHNPHEPLRTNDAAYYRARCLGCHQGCPQAPRASDCTSCHMPAVPANRHLRFRNHWIGVYNSASALKPARQSAFRALW